MILIVCHGSIYGFGKNEAALAEAAAEWGIDPKSEMYKLPSLNVGLMLKRCRSYVWFMARDEKRNYYTRLRIYYLEFRNRFLYFLAWLT